MCEGPGFSNTNPTTSDTILTPLPEGERKVCMNPKGEGEIKVNIKFCASALMKEQGKK
jgi:hypothetical protein